MSNMNVPDIWKYVYQGRSDMTSKSDLYRILSNIRYGMFQKLYIVSFFVLDIVCPVFEIVLLLINAFFSAH